MAVGRQEHANHNTNIWENLLFQRFYKISNNIILENSQTWCGDCVDH